jgi:hypothetical protein
LDTDLERAAISECVISIRSALFRLTVITAFLALSVAA